MNEIIIQPRKPLKECTSTIYSTINTGFEKKFGISFSEGLANMAETNLQLKPSTYEKRKEKRKLVKKFKATLQKDLDETAVNRCFGTRQSLMKWDTVRAIQSFETVTNAEKRTKENERKIQAGEKQTKNHVGKHASYTWDKSGLEKEVLLWDDKTVVNWTEVGKKYNIRD